jgi:hypothetical protein
MALKIPEGENMMRWLEVIKLRTAGNGEELLDELFRQIDKAGQDRGPVEIKTYRHAALETDLSLHLHWESRQPEQNGSILGLRLAQALTEFGLVDYSIWIEE